MQDLGGARVLVLGRLHGLTRRRLDGVVRRAGGRLVRRFGREVGIVAVAHGMARPLMTGHPALTTLERLSDGIELVSELSFKRRLGLLPAGPPEQRTVALDEFSRVSGVDEDLLFWLALFDVVEPGPEGYGYRDLVAAREVGRLLRAGVDLAALIEAAVQLRRDGTGLSQVRLAGSPTGEILREAGGRLFALDGQLALPLTDAVAETVDGVLAAAEDAEADGDLVEAERMYRRALMMDRSDPLAPFHLGNVLDAQGRVAEAALAWWIALQRDPAFPEAWFNLALASEAAARPEEAIMHYRLALAASPDYADAAYNLGLVLVDRGQHADALPLFEHFLKLEPRAKEAPLARRLAAECRLTLRAAAAAPLARRVERPAPRRR